MTNNNLVIMTEKGNTCITTVKTRNKLTLKDTVSVFLRALDSNKGKTPIFVILGKQNVTKKLSQEEIDKGVKFEVKDVQLDDGVVVEAEVLYTFETSVI